MWYDLITDADEYAFYFLDCLVERSNPDEVGLYALRAVRKADEDEHFTSYQNMNYAGIWLPGVDIPDEFEEKIDEILEIIGKQDKNALISMFSKDALVKDKNITESAEKLFSFLRGSVLSREADRWKYAAKEDEPIYHDKKTRFSGLIAWYTVVTDKAKYDVFFVDCINDSDGNAHTGLYSLQVIRADDTQAPRPWDWEDAYAGIYVP